MPDPYQRLAVLKRDPTPDMPRSGRTLVAPAQVVSHFRTSLGQNLEDVPICLFHYIEDPVNKSRGDVLMEKIAHGVDEDPT